MWIVAKSLLRQAPHFYRPWAGYSKRGELTAWPKSLNQTKDTTWRRLEALWLELSELLRELLLSLRDFGSAEVGLVGLTGFIEESTVPPEAEVDLLHRGLHLTPASCSWRDAPTPSSWKKSICWHVDPQEYGWRADNALHRPKSSIISKHKCVTAPIWTAKKVHYFRRGLLYAPSLCQRQKGWWGIGRASRSWS